MTPADNATGVAVGSNLTLTFSETIQEGTGNITLHKAFDDSLVQTFDSTAIAAGISGATVTLNPTSDLLGETAYYVKVDATAIEDTAGNDFAGITDATTLNFTTADVDAPMVSIIGAPDVISDLSPFIVTIQFTEDVTGFVMDDVTVGNGSVTAFTQVNASEYTVEITPTAPGDATIDVAAAVAKDLAGNDNEAADQVVVSFDSVRQTTGLIGAMLELRAKLILEHGPDLGRRLDLLNGTHSNNGGVTGFGLAYANGNLPFAVTLGKDKASFSYSLRNSRAEGGKNGLTGNIGSVATNVLGAAENYGSMPKNGYVGANTQALAYSGSLTNAERQALGVDASSSALAYAPTISKQAGLSDGDVSPLAMYEDDKGDADGIDPMSQRYDVWVEGHYSKFDATAGKGTFGIVHAGADYLVTKDILIGLGTQFDWIDMDASSGGGTADGWGFMVGPYMTAKLSPNLYLDGRAAWGKSYNRVSPYGTYEDPFDAQRWLATGALIGNLEAGNFTVRSEARLSYFRETSEAYVDSLSAAIPSVTTETGTFAFGPTISTRIAVDEDTVFMPFTTVTGIWTFEQKNTATALSNQPGFAQEGIRARIETGFDVSSKNGFGLSISGHYDGIGDSGFMSYGGKVNISQAF